MEENSKNFGDYLDALRRHRVSIGVIAAVIFVIGSMVALIWPPTYQSSATILVEEQEIPSELVRSTVTSYALQRIHEIKQRVMTRSRLMEIIEKYELYEKERKRDTIEQVISTMRDAIIVEPITADVLDQGGRAAVATIAFTLSYEGEMPRKVQKVANELTSVYLQENLKTRTSKAYETFKFLAAEANRHADEINALEQKLSEFQIRHIDKLSGIEHARAQLERAQYELDTTRDTVRSLHDRNAFLQQQLSATNPYGNDSEVVSPAARLKGLRTEHITLLAKYSESHPDVRRIEREIKNLELETGIVNENDAVHEELAAAKLELSTTEEHYAAEHPDVVRLKATVARLEKHLEENKDAKKTSTVRQRPPNNPEYITLQSQINQNIGMIKTGEQRKKDLRERLDRYTEHMAQLPEVERQYQSMSRAHENALAKYQEIKAKELQAKVAQQLEDESKGERFTIIEPAALPEEPISPNRPAIAFLSLILAIGGGVGFAAINENMDKSIRGIKGVVTAVKLAPLAVIPYLENDAEAVKNKRKFFLITSLTLAAIVTIVLLVHFLWAPLDVLWFRAIRKANRTTGLDI